MPEEDKTMIVKMAFLYVQSEEWYKAIEEYKKLLRMDPYDPHVYNMMGDAYAKKKDDKDAFEAYQESRELYSKIGNMNKVAAIDKKVSRLSPDRMDPQQKRLFLTITKSQEAERMAAEGNFDEAVAYFNQLIAAEPINFSYREKLANLFLDNAHVSDAVAQLKAVADFHLSEGRVDAALAYAGKISLIDPEGIDTLRLMAVLAKKKADTEGAAKHYGKLAQLAFDAGHYEEAKGAIDEAIAAGREDLKPLLAKILLVLKKHAEARQTLEALLREFPGDEVLLEQLLVIAEETKDWAGAHGFITALIQKRPDDPKLQPRLARVLLQVGKRADALQIYMNLALAALKDNKVEAAFSYFDNILALEPDNTEVLKKKAEFYLKQGKKQEVIDTYKKLQAVYTQKKMVEEAKRVGLILTKLAGLK